MNMSLCETPPCPQLPSPSGECVTGVERVMIHPVLRAVTASHIKHSPQFTTNKIHSTLGLLGLLGMVFHPHIQGTNPSFPPILSGTQMLSSGRLGGVQLIICTMTWPSPSNCGFPREKHRPMANACLFLIRPIISMRTGRMPFRPDIVAVTLNVKLRWSSEVLYPYHVSATCDLATGYSSTLMTDVLAEKC
jgi:hypothetical protein